jgi:hypothetical protein
VSAAAQTKSSGKASCITNGLGKSGGAVETGGSGRIAWMEGQYNPFGAKGPWVEVVAVVARGGLADNAGRIRKRAHRRRRACQTAGRLRVCRLGALPQRLRGKGMADGDAPRLGAVLGKTRRTDLRGVLETWP